MLMKLFLWELLHFGHEFNLKSLCHRHTKFATKPTSEKHKAYQLYHLLPPVLVKCLIERTWANNMELAYFDVNQ